MSKIFNRLHQSKLNNGIFNNVIKYCSKYNIDSYYTVLNGYKISIVKESNNLDKSQKEHYKITDMTFLNKIDNFRNM